MNSLLSRNHRTYRARWAPALAALILMAVPWTFAAQTIEEEFRLGDRDGPEEILFSGPLTAVSIGPQGQIFVLDQQPHEIRCHYIE